MTPKQQRFADEYMVDLNATQAAIRAGYSPKSAHVQSSRLLDNPKIAAYIANKREKQCQKAELSAVRVLEELRRLAFVDVAQLFYDDGRLKPLSEIPEEARAAIAGIETTVTRTKDGETHEEIRKIKLINKDTALTNLAKHFKVLTDKIEHEFPGGIVLKWEGDDE